MKPEPSDCASRWRPPFGAGGTRGILRSKNSRKIGGRPSRSGMANSPAPATRSGIFCRVLMLTTAGAASSTNSVKPGNCAWATTVCPKSSTASKAEKNHFKLGIDLKLPIENEQKAQNAEAEQASKARITTGCKAGSSAVRLLRQRTAAQATNRPTKADRITHGSLKANCSASNAAPNKPIKGSR